MKLITLAVAVLLLSSCGGADDGAAFPSESYSSAVQDRIDAAATDADCEALQSEFDTADTNDENAGRADLLTYIDMKLEGAGCY